MRFRTAIRWAKVGISILVIESVIEIVINLFILSDIFGYLNIFVKLLKMTGFLMIYVFFYTIEVKNKYMKDE